MAVLSEIAINGGPYDSTKIVENLSGIPVGDKAIDAAFIASMISCFVTNGVLDRGLDDLKVTAGEGLSVVVNPGITWSNGYMSRLDDTVTFELTPGHEYLVLVRQNNYMGYSKLVLYADNDGHVPIRNVNLHDMIVAKVTVPEGADEITENMIVDTRGDGALCGYVTSKLK